MTNWTNATRAAAAARGEWICGHPKTPENTQSVGVANWPHCRICRRIIGLRSYTKRKAEMAAA